jgi:hypothetical protein
MSPIQEHSVSVLGPFGFSQARGPCLAAAVVAFTSLLGGSAPVFAQPGIDRCDAILQQDLFNRVSNSTQSSSSERAAYEKQLFKMTETQAYEDYEKKFASSRAQATSGAAEFHYGIIGGELEFSHSYDRKLSSEDFSKTFKAAKERYDEKESSSTARDASLISLYQSSVHDAGTVSAWERCMVAKYPEPGLYAYGYRDASGDPYVVAMWLAGAFATTHPSLRVTFPQQSDAMTVVGATEGLSVAAGSGTAFPIRFGSEQDARAKEASFTVLINGVLVRSGQSLNSFRAEAVIPAYIGPVSCRRFFVAGQIYQWGVQGPPPDQLEWETFHLEASDETPDRLVAIFPAFPPMLGRMVLEFAGVEATLALPASPRKQPAPPLPIAVISCTSAGLITRPSGATDVYLPGTRMFVRPAR